LLLELENITWCSSQKYMQLQRWLAKC
jgi:hypothetical protein